MTKIQLIQAVALAALLAVTAGCPVDVNEGDGMTDDGSSNAECMSSELATVRIMHAAGGTPVTRPQFLPPTTRNLNVTRPDPKDATKTLTVTSLAPGRASLVQLCGNKPLMLGARLAGAKADRTTQMVTLTPDADPTKFEPNLTIVLAGISDDLKSDGTPENPKSAADPLRFILVPNTFGASPDTEIQVVHASRKTPALVDVETNPDRTGAEITALARYAISALGPTKGTPDTAPATVPIVFLEGTTTRASFTITPRIPAGAKALAIHFDTEVFDPGNPDMAGQNPAPIARLFLTGNDPLLGRVAGGGIQF